MARTFAVYTGLRVLLFVGSYGVLLVLGLPGLPALAFAFLLSGVLSLLLLRRPRDRFVVALEQRRAAKVEEQERLRGLLDERPPGE